MKDAAYTYHRYFKWFLDIRIPSRILSTFLARGVCWAPLALAPSTEVALPATSSRRAAAIQPGAHAELSLLDTGYGCCSLTDLYINMSTDININGINVFIYTYT